MFRCCSVRSSYVHPLLSYHPLDKHSVRLYQGATPRSLRHSTVAKSLSTSQVYLNPPEKPPFGDQLQSARNIPDGTIYFLFLSISLSSAQISGPGPVPEPARVSVETRIPASAEQQASVKVFRCLNVNSFGSNPF